MPAKQASRTTTSRRVFGHRTKTQIRAGLYARVSTHDQQTLKLQNRAMQDYAARRGWTVAIEVKEVGSGASVRELRQKYSKLPAAGISMWSSSGGSTAGGDPWPIW
jgi:predicted site-specific integrase-resolvase